MAEIEINHTPLHDDPMIAAFLSQGGYESIDEWARDSDYRYSPISGGWHTMDYPGDMVELDEQIVAAMDSSGFTEDFISVHGA